MGCIFSLGKDENNRKYTYFVVVNVDEQKRDVGQEGRLTVAESEIVFVQKGKAPSSWPLAAVKKYGYEQDIFSIEVGRRCPGGPGIYAFRCNDAGLLYNEVQEATQLVRQQRLERITDGEAGERARGARGRGVGQQQLPDSASAQRVGGGSTDPAEAYVNSEVITSALENRVAPAEPQHNYVNSGSLLFPQGDAPLRKLPSETVQYSRVGGEESASLTRQSSSSQPPSDAAAQQSTLAAPDAGVTDCSATTALQYVELGSGDMVPSVASSSEACNILGADVPLPTAESLRTASLGVASARPALAPASPQAPPQSPPQTSYMNLAGASTTAFLEADRLASAGKPPPSNGPFPLAETRADHYVEVDMSRTRPPRRLPKPLEISNCRTTQHLPDRGQPTNSSSPPPYANISPGLPPKSAPPFTMEFSDVADLDSPKLAYAHLDLESLAAVQLRHPRHPSPTQSSSGAMGSGGSADSGDSCDSGGGGVAQLNYGSLDGRRSRRHDCGVNNGAGGASSGGGGQQSFSAALGTELLPTTDYAQIDYAKTQALIQTRESRRFELADTGADGNRRNDVVLSDGKPSRHFSLSQERPRFRGRFDSLKN